MLACYAAQFNSASLYLNIATFLPLVADNKFGAQPQISANPPLSDFEVTLIIIAYEIAYVLMPLFVLPMINYFGRKRCVLIGFSIDAISSVLFAMTDYYTAGQSR